MKLRTRLLLVLVLTVAILGGSVYGSLELYKQQVVEQEERDIAETAALTADHIDSRIADRADQVGFVASKPEMRAFDDAAPFLDSFLQNTRFFAVQLVDADGTVREFRGDVTDEQRSTVVGQNVADEPYVSTAMNGGVYIGEPEVMNGSTGTDGAVVIFSAPVYNRTDVVGVLAAGLRIDSTTVLSPVGASEDESQRVVVRSDDVVLHDRTRSFEHEISESATVASTGWRVTVVRDVTPTYQLIDDLQLVQGVGIAVVLLLVAGFGRWEYRTTLNQTEKLLVGFERAREGEYEGTVSLAASDEWVEIGEGFNELVDRIADREAELEERRQRLEVLNRVLRHNVRNSTTAILGYAELGLDSSDAAIEQASNIIISHAEQLHGMSETARRVEQVIDSDESATEVVDVSAMVRASVAAVRTIDPEATISLSVPPAVSARANPQAEMAIRQLCRNALQHNPGDDRHLTVDVRETVVDGDDVVRIDVADNGLGLPDDQLAVLESGRETPLEHGEGLGLWLVYWVTKRSGGRISFSTSDEGGCLATLELPAAADSVDDD